MSTRATLSKRSSWRGDPGLLVVAGAGLIGSRLVDPARDSGWRIRTLHRSAADQAPQEDIEVDAIRKEHVWWASAKRFLPSTALGSIRTVVCLPGAPIAPHPWTLACRREPVASRSSATVLIIRVNAGLPPVGRPEILLSGLATGFYGDRGDETLTGTSGPGEGFLSELCRRQESVAGSAAQARLRTVRSRTNLVISFSGGLGRILGTAYRVGTGVWLGRGNQ